MLERAATIVVVIFIVIIGLVWIDGGFDAASTSAPAQRDLSNGWRKVGGYSIPPGSPGTEKYDWQEWVATCQYISLGAKAEDADRQVCRTIREQQDAIKR